MRVREREILREIQRLREQHRERERETDRQRGKREKDKESLSQILFDLNDIQKTFSLNIMFHLKQILNIFVYQQKFNTKT